MWEAPSGKSSFLNASCLTNAKVANYPFTTTTPNVGTSYAKTKCVCQELEVQDNPKNSYCTNGLRFIPVKLLDVPGLVPDAHLGKGMGNEFLSKLITADALIHVVDISGSLDAEGNEVDEGTHNPMDDINFLENEINYWFKDILTRTDWSKFVRKIKTEKLSFVDLLNERLNGLSIRKEHIVTAIKISKLNLDRITEWTDDDILHFAACLRQTANQS